MKNQYADGDLVTVFTFDEKGYFAGLSAWQYTEADGLITTADAVTVAPWGDEAMNPAVWYKWDGAKWQTEAKPANPADVVGVPVPMADFTPHGIELREIVRAFAGLEGYFEEVADGFLTLRKQPEKTEAEKMEEALNAEIQAYEEKVKDLNYRIGLAVLANDEEEIESLRAEYAKLQEEE